MIRTTCGHDGANNTWTTGDGVRIDMCDACATVWAQTHPTPRTNVECLEDGVRAILDEVRNDTTREIATGAIMGLLECTCAASARNLATCLDTQATMIVAGAAKERTTERANAALNKAAAIRQCALTARNLAGMDETWNDVAGMVVTMTQDGMED